MRSCSICSVLASDPFIWPCTSSVGADWACHKKAGLVPAELASRLQRLVGFRNVAVHDYTSLNLDILNTIITTHLDDFRRFSSTIVKSCA
ncbi:MAG: DUF86 domain-containing protein [Nitrospira sp.]|nr:DUF86 domain-containing protein [Nitrospira sp.]